MNDTQIDLWTIINKRLEQKQLDDIERAPGLRQEILEINRMQSELEQQSKAVDHAALHAASRVGELVLEAVSAVGKIENLGQDEDWARETAEDTLMEATKIVSRDFMDAVALIPTDRISPAQINADALYLQQIAKDLFLVMFDEEHARRLELEDLKWAFEAGGLNVEIISQAAIKQMDSRDDTYDCSDPPWRGGNYWIILDGETKRLQVEARRAARPTGLLARMFQRRGESSDIPPTSNTPSLRP